MGYQKFDEMRDGKIRTVYALKAYVQRLEPHVEPETMLNGQFENISEGIGLLKGMLASRYDFSPVPELAANMTMIIEAACSEAYDKFCAIQRRNSLNLAPRPAYC